MTAEEKIKFLLTIFSHGELAALLKDATNEEIDDLIARLIKYGTNG